MAQIPDETTQELRQKFAELEEMTKDTNQTIGTTERFMIRCTLALGATVLRLDEDIRHLDRTSSLLSKANIGIGVVILVVAIVQVVIMIFR